jgi:hypothetical protein
MRFKPRSWRIVPVSRRPYFDPTWFLGRLGRVWREADFEATDFEATDFETVITDLLEGQYKNPIGIFAFNTSEGWAFPPISRSSYAGAAICSFATCRQPRKGLWIDTMSSIGRSSRCRCARYDDPPHIHPAHYPDGSFACIHISIGLQRDFGKKPCRYYF